ncbi:hypothetical protein SAMN04488054_1102 [Salibacterium qingdaonense]|uniref:Uncharacterized protein n=1 Tax=Salibacterium qingdaonense TaxID=266892 RepID=A0A1I4M2J2_9BACI|nr:hypothetical protein SAMN04488054_1102 [Salibacterium qingdaonense]
MSCGVVQQSNGSGAKMLRLLREQHESQDPAGSDFLPRRLEPCPRQRRHDKRQRIDVALVLWSKSEAFWRSGLSQQRKMPNDFLKSFGIFLSYRGFVPDSFCALRIYESIGSLF